MLEWMLFQLCFVVFSGSTAYEPSGRVEAQWLVIIGKVGYKKAEVES